MGKYAPLKNFLEDLKVERLAMTFQEIEGILNLPLPASKQYPAWWSNNSSNNPMTREWLNAGFETESVNIAAEKLVFRRIKRKEKSLPAPSSAAQKSGSSIGLHPGFGFMKGQIKIAKGFDVTKPFDDEPWDEGYLGVEERE